MNLPLEKNMISQSSEDVQSDLRFEISDLNLATSLPRNR